MSKALMRAFLDKLAEKERQCRSNYRDALYSTYESDKAYAAKYEAMADVLNEVCEALEEALNDA